MVKKQTIIIQFPKVSEFRILILKYAQRESVQIRSFFWPVFSRIQSECGKIRTRKTSVFGHFSHIDVYS